MINCPLGWQKHVPKCPPGMCPFFSFRPCPSKSLCTPLFNGNSFKKWNDTSTDATIFTYNSRDQKCKMDCLMSRLNVEPPMSPGRLDVQRTICICHSDGWGWSRDRMASLFRQALGWDPSCHFHWRMVAWNTNTPVQSRRQCSDNGSEGFCLFQRQVGGVRTNQCEACSYKEKVGE